MFQKLVMYFYVTVLLKKIVVHMRCCVSCLRKLQGAVLEAKQLNLSKQAHFKQHLHLDF